MSSLLTLCLIVLFLNVNQTLSFFKLFLSAVLTEPAKNKKEWGGFKFSIVLSHQDVRSALFFCHTLTTLLMFFNRQLYLPRIYRGQVEQRLVEQQVRPRRRILPSVSQARLVLCGLVRFVTSTQTSCLMQPCSLSVCVTMLLIVLIIYYNFLLILSLRIIRTTKLFQK